MNLLYNKIITKKEISNTEQEKISKLNLNQKYVNKHLNLSKVLGFHSSHIIENKKPYSEDFQIEESLFQMLENSSNYTDKNIIKEYMDQFYKVNFI